MKIKKEFRSLFENYPIDFGLLIFISYAIPAAYGLLNRYFIGFMPYESVVVDQSYEGVEVLLEVLLEIFPVAVLALVSRNYLEEKPIPVIVGTALKLQLAVTIAFIVILLFFVDTFIDWINTPESAQGLARKFFITSSLAIPFHSMTLLILISIKSIRNGKMAIFLASIGVVINFLLDAFLISNFQFSFKLGLIGSAYGKIISSILMFSISFFALVKILKKDLIDFFVFDRKTAKSIFRIGAWTGLESLVRNLGYLIGVVSVINFLEQSEQSVIGGYNTAMWVMWAIVLIPVLAWTEATNVAIGNANGKNDFQAMKRIQIGSLILVAIYMGIWIIFGNVIWEPVSSWLNTNAKPEVLTYSKTTFHFLIFPYFLFAIGSILKSYFIGTGKPFWVFFSSAIVNLGIYVPLGLLIKSDLVKVSFIEFLIVSNVVFFLDFAIILYALWRFGFKGGSE